MTKRTYRGDATDRPQITRISPPAGGWTDPVSLGISNKRVTLASWNLANMVTAWNAATAPELRAAIASADGTDFLLTSRVAGTPFEAIANYPATIADDQVASGRWHFADPANWQNVTGDDESIPNSGDQIIFESGRISCLYGLRQACEFEAVDDNLALARRCDFRVGQLVMVRTTGILPLGLDATDVYEIVAYNRYSGVMTLELDGDPITIEDAGSGTHVVRLALDALAAPALYSGQIGLPQWNTAGYQEYLPTALEIGLDPLGSRRVILGQGSGQGSSRLKFDFGADAINLSVYRTSNSAEAGVPAAIFAGTNDQSAVDVYGGEIGLGFFEGQEFRFQRLTNHSGRLSYGRLVSSADAELNNLGGSLDGRELVFSGRVQMQR